MSRSTRPMTPALRAARTTGEIFVTVGIVILLFVYWLLYWTDVVQHRSQHALSQQLSNAWQDPTYSVEGVKLGQGLAVLRIPRFGKDYHQVIVQGVSESDLEKGPGHITSTAEPGEKGNFVVSGHRTTYGHPFNQLDELRPGDVVVLETHTAYLTYKVDMLTQVLPEEYHQVADPVPSASRFHKPGRYITFTTCTPKYSASHRLIMFGDLVESDPKATGFVPKSLRPGVVTIHDMAKQV